MNFRRFASAFAFWFLICLCVFAAEPWKNKPFEKWNAADVRHILDNSPWAKISRVPWYPQLNGDKPEVGAALQVGKVPDTSLDTPADASRSVANPDMLILVRWNSSATIRHALFRDAVLRGMPQAEAEERFLKNPPEKLEFVMLATGGSLLPPSEPESLVPETYLLLLPSGRKIRAIGANTTQAIDSHNGHGYSFEFPARMQDGSPTIAAGVEKVRFVCRMGVRDFRTEFKTAEMIAGGGVDLR